MCDRAQLDFDILRSQMRHDLIQRRVCDESEIGAAGQQRLCLGLELLADLVQVKFLVAESKSRPAATECFHAHAKSVLMEIVGSLDRRDGEHYGGDTDYAISPPIKAPTGA